MILNEPIDVLAARMMAQYPYVDPALAMAQVGQQQATQANPWAAMTPQALAALQPQPQASQPTNWAQLLKGAAQMPAFTSPNLVQPVQASAASPAGGGQTQLTFQTNQTPPVRSPVSLADLLARLR